MEASREDSSPIDALRAAGCPAGANARSGCGAGAVHAPRRRLRGHIITGCHTVTVGRRRRRPARRQHLPVATVEPVTAAELGATWRPGCPVEPERLRRVNVDYLGFDGQTQRGELIVHEDLAPEVIAIFEQLYRLGYPVEKIRTVDHYADANDELSMEDNNTSAFNCRTIPGTDEWSPHAYGRAIDHQSAYQPVPLRQRVFRTAERGGLPGPQPHRPGTLTQRRPGRARLHGSWLAVGWLLEDSRLPTLRAALKSQGLGRRRRNLTSQIRYRWTASRVDRVREQNYVGI